MFLSTHIKYLFIKFTKKLLLLSFVFFVLVLIINLIEETNFLKTGKNLGNKTENGRKMFIYQAAESFKIWHDINPEINEKYL